MSLFRSRLGLMVLVGAISMFVLAVGPAGVAQADDVFNVTHQTDTSQGDDNCQPGDCSLRQAVEAADNSQGDDDTINVPAGTYLLDNGRLRLDRCPDGAIGSVTITGAGARDTIVDGQSNDRVFKIYCGDAVITDLTIRHGERETGAGVLNYGNLTLRNVAVIDNVASDCHEIDVTTDTNGPSIECCDPGQGAGIYNDGELLVEQSLIANNTAKAGKNQGGEGGGIYNEWLMDLTNVTLNNNVAEDLEFDPPSLETNAASSSPGAGGAIFQDPYFFNQAQTNVDEPDYISHLLNLTIAGNTAGLGGGIALGYFGQNAPDTNEALPTLIDLKNTIVANNEATYNFVCATNGVCADTNVTDGADNCFVIEGSTASLGHNLESDTSCNFTEPGDQQNTEPNLGGLANNGGPTNTLALNAGSPALDTADNAACPGTDQRYVTRPQGPVCDIGAYEREVAAPVTPPQGAVAPVAAQAKPTAKSSISGPRSCTRGKATVRVSGQNIASVTYSLDGKKKKTAKGNKTSFSFSLKNAKSGVHRVTAKVSYTQATASSPQTKRFTVSRCARAAVAPKFTG